MLEGSCLCGAIAYRIAGKLGPITLCHCAQCRKAQGSAFVAAATVRTAEFSLTRGGEVLRRYESSPGKVRAFCANCGSPIYSQRASEAETLRLRVGTLDTPISAKPAAHIWVEGKAEWDEICDAIAQYPRFEPGR